MSTFHRCAGCLADFSSSGYERHLRTTTKPACVALRERAQVYETSDEDPDEDQLDDPAPLPFEGDALGDYDNDYWDQYVEYQGPDDDSEDTGEAELMDQDDPADLEDDDDGTDEGLRFGADEIDGEDDLDLDDEEARNFAAEHGWEPPLPAEEQAGVPLEKGGVEDSTQSGPDRREQRRAHQHLRTTTHIVAFPGGKAGSPIHIRLEGSAYSIYRNTLESPASPNPFAPFRSRLDWDIARWAKMRGPGSTAVTELLQIEGVRHMPIISVILTNSD